MKNVMSLGDDMLANAVGGVMQSFGKNTKDAFKAASDAFLNLSIGCAEADKAALVGLKNKCLEMSQMNGINDQLLANLMVDMNMACTRLTPKSQAEALKIFSELQKTVSGC